MEKRDLIRDRKADVVEEKKKKICGGQAKKTTGVVCFGGRKGSKPKPEQGPGLGGAGNSQSGGHRSKNRPQIKKGSKKRPNKGKNTF